MDGPLLKVRLQFFYQLSELHVLMRYKNFPPLKAKVAKCKCVPQFLLRPLFRTVFTSFCNRVKTIKWQCILKKTFGYYIQILLVIMFYKITSLPHLVGKIDLSVWWWRYQNKKSFSSRFLLQKCTQILDIAFKRYIVKSDYC